MIYGNFNNFLILIFVDNITDLNLTRYRKGQRDRIKFSKQSLLRETIYLYI